MEVYNNYGRWYDLIYSWKDYSGEVGMLAEYFKAHGDGRVKRILDLGCGTGGHTALLAKRGYELVGLDGSPTMLAKAKEKMHKYWNRADFILSDFNDLCIRGREDFDAALVLFNAFGYIRDTRKTLQFLSTVNRTLRHGGLLIIDTWNIVEIARKETATETMEFEREGYSGKQVANRTFDIVTGMYEGKFELFIYEGKGDKKRMVDRFSEEHKLRCYSIPELSHYLEESGFSIAGVYEDYTFEAPRADTRELTFVAVKK